MGHHLGPILISFSRNFVNVQCRTDLGNTACRRSATIEYWMLSPAPIVGLLCCRSDQAQRLIQFPIGQQTGIGGDLGTVEL